MTLDTLEELKNEIATKHGIAISQDDPIFILHTLNEHLMRENVKAQQVMLEQFKAEMEAISQGWSMNSKEKAEKILNTVLAASKKMMENGAYSIIESFKTEINETPNIINSQLSKEARKLTKLNLFASSLTLIAAVIVFWAALS